jgi:hypothetical protein
MLVCIPRDLEDRQLNEVDKLFLNFAIRFQVRDVTGTYRRQ